MPFSNYKRLLVFVLSVLSILSLSSTASAKLEQTMLSVDKKDKKVTFTIYHFHASKQVSLTDVAESIGDSVEKQRSKAAISASSGTSFSYKAGKFIFPPSTQNFIKNGALSNPSTSRSSTKRTFILTNEKEQHAIGYAPNTTEEEFGYALLQYIANSKMKFTRVVIVDSGNQCGFYKGNGKYNAYYLKELKKPAKVITIK